MLRPRKKKTRVPRAKKSKNIEKQPKPKPSEYFVDSPTYDEVIKQPETETEAEEEYEKVKPRIRRQKASKQKTMQTRQNKDILCYLKETHDDLSDYQKRLDGYLEENDSNNEKAIVKWSPTHIYHMRKDPRDIMHMQETFSDPRQLMNKKSYGFLSKPNVNSYELAYPGPKGKAFDGESIVSGYLANGAVDDFYHFDMDGKNGDSQVMTPFTTDPPLYLEYDPYADDDLNTQKSMFLGQKNDYNSNRKEKKALFLEDEENEENKQNEVSDEDIDKWSDILGETEQECEEDDILDPYMKESPDDPYPKNFRTDVDNIAKWKSSSLDPTDNETHNDSDEEDEIEDETEDETDIGYPLKNPYNTLNVILHILLGVLLIFFLEHVLKLGTNFIRRI